MEYETSGSSNRDYIDTDVKYDTGVDAADDCNNNIITIVKIKCNKGSFLLGNVITRTDQTYGHFAMHKTNSS